MGRYEHQNCKESSEHEVYVHHGCMERLVITSFQKGLYFHKNLFLVSARTQEGALTLAKLAIEA